MAMRYEVLLIAFAFGSLCEGLQDSAFVHSSFHPCIVGRSRACVRPSLRPATYKRANVQTNGVSNLASVAEGFALAGSLGAMLTAVDFSTLGSMFDATLLADAVTPDTAAAASAASAVATDAAAAATTAAANPGLYDSFVNVIEQSLILLHSSMKAIGVPGAWGMSIILFTVLVKAVTYPLNFKQMSSTIQMQNLQPKLKALQSRYQNDPQKLNEMTAKLYQDEKVNPLAGCIPTLIQIPIFIALYRSLLDLAKRDLMTESFLWIPSLEGPVGQYSPTTGLPIDGTAWLFKGWTDGHPAMGWEDTLAYLSIPVVLVISQYLSQKVLNPTPSDDPAQQQTQQILKFLPLMIGWFSLNVPAGLGVYWVINNLLSTSQQWYIRQQVKAAQPAMAGGSAATDQSVDLLRDQLREGTATKLRSAEDLKFKVGKKSDSPTPASVASPVTVAAADQGEVSDNDDDEGSVGESSGEASSESKSAAKKKAKALKTKK